MERLCCCFTGHRVLPPGVNQILFDRVCAKIGELYAVGVRSCYTGGARGFDFLAAEAVLRCKSDLPGLRLIVVVPHEGQERSWSLEEKRLYTEINQSADQVICLAEHYFRGCMQKRNHYMVDHSSICVCYLTKTDGGTAGTVKYARAKGLAVINLAEPILVLP